MPIHDWMRVGSNVYHDFHLGLVLKVASCLNAELLPSGYYAMTEYGHRLRTTKEPVETFDDVTDEDEFYYLKRRAIAVRRQVNDDYTALVEILSPGVARPQFLELFVGKLSTALRRGINVLLVDLFSTDTHNKLWHRLTGNTYAPPPDRLLSLAAYEAHPSEPRCYVQPLAAGDEFPDMPLFVEPGYYVPVPLERCYQEAFAHVLPQHRALLEPSAKS